VVPPTGLIVRESVARPPKVHKPGPILRAQR
jgi:hypothetical protein